MFKLFRKKLNKKGFTLAELLIVVAIVAILVAIAIPIFTNALERAQISVNEANARSLKGAAVSEILEKWDTLSVGATSYTGPGAVGKGWVASGKVDAQGNVKELHVYVANTSQSPFDPSIEKPDGMGNPIEAVGSANMAQPYAAPEAGKATTKKALASESGAIKPEYWVVVYINEIETIKVGS